MQDKLQQLTDRLYEEGLAKGKAKAEELVADAGKQAEEIIAGAREKADRIISDAQRQAADLKAKTESDIRMASCQTIATVRKQVENIIKAEMIDAPLSATLSNPSFVGDLLSEVIKSFNAAASEPQQLEVMLSPSLKEGLEDYCRTKTAAILKEGVDVKYVKGMAKGFKIGPKDGGWIISFTDEDFSGLLSEYLRPLTRKILFGE